MKRKIAALCYLCFGIGYLALHAATGNFAGTWVLDKSSPLPGDAPGKLETRIRQNDNGLTIESKFREPSDGVVPLLYLGVMTNRLQLDTNGSEVHHQVGPFEMALRTTMTNEHQLDTDWKGVINGDPVTGHWTHTLSEDGKRLTLDIREQSTRGQHSQAKLVFVRK